MVRGTSSSQNLAFSKRAVLLVDDDPVSLLYYKACLPKDQYECVSSFTVAQAQDEIRKRERGFFDCVLTDYHMPEQTGIDLLEWLQGADSTLASVVVTAEGQKNLVAQSLKRGATDFLEKPVNKQLLCEAVDEACRTTRNKRVLLDNFQAVKELEHLRKSFYVAHDHSLKAHLDTVLFPKYEMGGDFFEFFEFEDRQVLLCGDVSGHDLKAAYISSYFQGMVHGMLKSGASVPDILQHFNSILNGRFNRVDSKLSSKISLSVVFVEWNEREALLKHYNCGFPLPIIFNDNGEVVELKQWSEPLGWFESPQWTQESVPYGERTQIIVHTDGMEDLAELLNVNVLSLGLMLSDKKSHPQKESILSLAKDDILSVRVCSRSGDKEGVGQIFFFDNYTKDAIQQIDALQVNWRKSLELVIGKALDKELMYDILLCVREAMLNALTHGMVDGDGRSSLSMTLDSEHRHILVRIDDPGPGFSFDIEKRKECLDELREGQMGLILVQSIPKEVIFQRNGATVLMYFNLSGGDHVDDDV